MNRDDTCLRYRWQPVYRRHELNTGFGMERESFVLDEKGNDKWQKPRGRIPMPERGSGLLIVAMKLLVMGVEPRGSVIRLMNVANPLCGDERQERLGNGSRMTRECHVRFCGEAQGEIPWAYSPCVTNTSASSWCCIRDGRWPPEAGLQEQASNCPGAAAFKRRGGERPWEKASN